jgi:CRISPR-associated protein Cas1
MEKHSLSGMSPPERQELPRLADCVSFVFLDDCSLERDNGAIRVRNKQGFMDLPAAGITVLLLGPGTSVTHRAIQCASEAGLSIVWVGEEGVRYYASGRALSGSSALLLRQASIATRPAERLAAAKRMYAIRYPSEEFSRCTMRQLLGKEGRHVSARYRELAAEFGIEWSGRRYSAKEFEKNDPLQNALSCANACLYGLCWAVISAMGLSPGLGFIHTGMDRSFVLDVADLYKEAISFPAAFEAAAQGSDDIDSRVRRRLRDIMKDKRFPGLIWLDIETILGSSSEQETEGRNQIWYDFYRTAGGGRMYD